MNSSTQWPHASKDLPNLVVCVLIVATLAGCSRGCERQVDTSTLPRHTLVYGGDMFTARRLNYALFDEQARGRLFEDLAPVLQKADLAMINLEGMITTGGHFNKLANSTYMFRAHPHLLEVLQDSGVDIVTVGNNHVPDYGPEALVEMTDRLKQAGIGYVGAGEDQEDAERTLYRKVGDTVVAFIAADLSYTRRYAARDDRAGSHYVREALKRDRNDRLVAEHFSRLAREAREHAHVVFFSPHWDAWEDPPVVSERMRSLAKELLEGEFDAILAHGRHQTQGVEVFDGLPVIYDAGNTLLDYNTGSEDSRGMLWQIEFTRAGVHSLEGIPLDLSFNRSNLAKGRTQKRIIDRIVERSEELGTTLTVADGRVRLELDPGGVRGPREAEEPPRREPPETIRQAPTDAIHERLPAGVTKLDVQWENDIHLLGYELLAPSIRARSSTHQVVMLYWRTDREMEDNYVVHLEARHVEDGRLTRRRRRAHHLPGDWMIPTPLWPVGKIIQDGQVFRLHFPPEGAVAFFVGLRKLGDHWNVRRPDGRLLRPEHSSVDLFEEQLVPVGRSPYSKQAPRMRKVYREWRKNRDIQLARDQAWGAPSGR